MRACERTSQPAVKTMSNHTAHRTTIPYGIGIWDSDQAVQHFALATAAQDNQRERAAKPFLSVVPKWLQTKPAEWLTRHSGHGVPAPPNRYLLECLKQTASAESRVRLLAPANYSLSHSLAGRLPV